MGCGLCGAPRQVSKGHIEVDQSAMTGESLPVSSDEGAQLKMGSTVVGGEAEAVVEVSAACGHGK